MIDGADGLSVSSIKFGQDLVEVEYLLLPTGVRGGMSCTQTLRVPYEALESEGEVEAMEGLFGTAGEIVHRLILMFEGRDPVELEEGEVDLEPGEGPYDNPADRR